MIQLKTLRATCKAVEDGSEPDGTFEALVSTYDVDSVGDKVAPGAFGKSLAEWKESGEPIPVIWSHQHSDPFAHIGSVVDAEEKEGEGLYVKAALDLDNPTAAQVYRLLKGGRVRQFSFAYDVRGADGPDSAGVTTLTDLKLYEVGPTLIGANQETRTLAVKSGRVLSTKNETDLRQAVDLITGVLSQLDAPASSETPQEPKTSGTGPAKDEEPAQAKSEEPSPNPSVDAFAVALALKQRKEMR